MREIKFRAWDGKDIIYYDRYVMMSYCRQNEYLLFGCVSRKESKNWETIPHTNSPLDLMQYTGLKDKNGKEIYDRDIIRFNSGKVCSIKIDDENTGFVLTNNMGFITSANSHVCEVIGNIYENPELIKE